jgi:hypothetical protein
MAKRSFPIWQMIVWAPGSSGGFGNDNTFFWLSLHEHTHPSNSRQRQGFLLLDILRSVTFPAASVNQRVVGSSSACGAKNKHLRALAAQVKRRLFYGGDALVKPLI